MGEFFSAVFEVLSTEAAFTAAARFAVLLAFAAAGEWVAERAGTLNISVEGMLLGGAFAAAMGFHITESVAVGLVCAMLAGGTVSMVQAQMSHRLTADPFVVGLTLNILVLGVVGFLESELKPSTRLASVVEVPFLVDLPLVGRALFGQPWRFYLIYVVVPFCGWLLLRTRWGLEVRAVGENPQSADVSGIHVNHRRRQSIYLAGLMAGLGGGYLLFGQVGRFEPGMVGGRGFIALVAVIFGGWRLRATIFGCLLFESVLSFRLTLPALGYQLNNELLSSLPFLVTIVATSLFVRATRQPAALARPFIRGLK